MYSWNMEKHAQHFRGILPEVRDFRICAKAARRQFAMTEIESLGQQITSQGMRPIEGVLRAVRGRHGCLECSLFLGFANLNRKCTYTLVEIAAPLAQSTKTSDPRQWDPLQGKAFSGWKQTLCNAPILIRPDPELPNAVETVAPNFAVWGQLMQDDGDKLKPIVFMSRILTPTEGRYFWYRR